MIKAARFVLPRSITGQITGLVVAALIVAHILMVAAVLFGQPQLLFGNASSVFIGSVTALVRTVDAEPVETRDRAISRAAAAIAGSRVIAAADLQPVPEAGPGAAGFLKTLRTVLGDPDRVVLARPAKDDGAETLLIAIKQDNESFLAFPLKPESQKPPATILLLLAMSLAVTLIVLSAWATKQITAPLRSFAAAAEQFGVSIEPSLIEESGPAEVRQASRTLNNMLTRIRKLIDERTQMLAAISHDLRTPLTRLRLRIETMPDPAIQRDAISDIRSMETMINAALEYLRDENIRSKRMRVDLAALLQTVCNDFSDCGFRVRYDGPLHTTAVCDPDLMTRAIANLVNNGCNHGDTVDIRLRVTSDYHLIEIEDNGPGLSDEDKAHIFEPFYRGDPSRAAQNSGGFGLGLSISKAIIEEHGGTIALQNRAGGGLKVSVALSSAETLVSPGGVTRS